MNEFGPQVRMPKEAGSSEGRELYPLDTNLLKTPVAGGAVQGKNSHDVTPCWRSSEHGAATYAHAHACASPVVGIGVQLHFNFQFFLIASQWQGHTGSYQTVAEYIYIYMQGV